MRVPATFSGAFFLVSGVLSSAAGAQSMPAGGALDDVTAICVNCHSVRNIVRSSGYSRKDWETLIATMVDLSGVPDTKETLLDYLAKNYPPNSKRASVTVPGSRALKFEAWQVPTLGQRARDPVEDADGNIWWVGQWGDIVGRLNPTTGGMTEFALPLGAKPHSVDFGPKGYVWYTGNKNATMGRLDPATGDIREYPMPDPAARDPHTHVFDREGILWFTLQGSNMIGRLDPDSGATELVKAPTKRSRPYGIKVAADGSIWVACNGSNCLLRVDPQTMAVTEIKLPGEGTHVRRLDIDAEGRIWWVNSGLGKLGRYTPETGDMKVWDSPSGPKSHPYALVIYKGAVWYNESGVRPDMLVRFDMEKESFQSWPIPSGDIHAGILRHMRTTRDGKSILIHQTATNQIMRVTDMGGK